MWVPVDPWHPLLTPGSWVTGGGLSLLAIPTITSINCLLGQCMGIPLPLVGTRELFQLLAISMCKGNAFLWIGHQPSHPVAVDSLFFFYFLPFKYYSSVCKAFYFLSKTPPLKWSWEFTLVQHWSKKQVLALAMKVGLSDYNSLIILQLHMTWLLLGMTEVVSLASISL